MTFFNFEIIVFTLLLSNSLSQLIGLKGSLNTKPIYTMVNPFKNITVVEGTSIFFSCNTSLQYSDIHWLHDGKFLPKQGGHHIITQTGELYIRNIKAALHAGPYACLAASTETEDLSESVHITVQIPAEIIEGPENRNISYGHTITTYCVSIGDPIPRIYWVKNGAIVIDDGTNTRYSGAKLLLNVTSAIEITCHAYNILIDGTHRAYKTGIVRPIIYDLPKITKFLNEKDVTTHPTKTTTSSISICENGECSTTHENPKWKNLRTNSNSPSLSHNTSFKSVGSFDDTRTSKLDQNYFPPLSLVLMWAGFPLLLISFFIIAWIGCRKCVIDKRSPFSRCKGASSTYEDVINSSVHHSRGDTSHDSTIRRILAADLPINQNYYDRRTADHQGKNRSRASFSERNFSSTNVSEYPRNDILYVRDLGQGAFGHVFQAKAPGLMFSTMTSHDDSHDSHAPMVAVKMIKEGMEGDRELEDDFAREARLMSQFNHPNILKLLAMCSVGKPLCLLLEYMCNGDLHHFLRHNSPEPRDNAINKHLDIGYESSSMSPYLFEQNVAGTFEKLLASGNHSYRAKKKLFKSQAYNKNCKNAHLRTEKGELPSLNVFELLYMAQQIVTGMVYLSSRNYVHRDLAARNCLVGPRLTIKISDFGLCRKIASCTPTKGPPEQRVVRTAPSLAECGDSDDSGGDYYTTLRVRRALAIPIRWMPPEAIVWNEFSIASDVWSMGIVMWEIFTFALQPYFWLKNNDEIINFLKHGRRLPKPKLMTNSIYKTIVMECWKGKVNQRPSFRRIYDALMRIESELRLTNTANI